jgi:hypothetical protein
MFIACFYHEGHEENEGKRQSDLSNQGEAGDIKQDFLINVNVTLLKQGLKSFVFLD